MASATSAKGDIAEQAVVLGLLRAGRTVLRPLGSSLRYDLVVDEGEGHFTRVQCKSAVFRRGCLYFRACSADGRRPAGVPYLGQVDAFGVYSPDLHRCFLVPVEACRVSKLGALRVEPTRSSQVKGIRYASQYELPLTARA